MEIVGYRKSNSRIGIHELEFGYSLRLATSILSNLSNLVRIRGLGGLLSMLRVTGMSGNLDYPAQDAKDSPPCPAPNYRKTVSP